MPFQKFAWKLSPKRKTNCQSLAPLTITIGIYCNGLRIDRKLFQSINLTLSVARQSVDKKFGSKLFRALIAPPYCKISVFCLLFSYRKFPFASEIISFVDDVEKSFSNQVFFRYTKKNLIGSEVERVL